MLIERTRRLKTCMMLCLDNFYSDDFITLTTYHLFEEFIREIYHEFLTNSHPSGDEYGYTIEDMKQDDFDWWEMILF